MDKKETRDRFRYDVLKRDGYACVMCGFKPEYPDELDAHHITDRNSMPFGGYVPLNGITLCTDRSSNSENCHRKAEQFHQYGVAAEGFSPADLYKKIKTSYWNAYFETLQRHIRGVSEIANLNRDFREAHAEEQQICILLGEINETTWLLACDKLNITEPAILIYGKGRTCH